MPQSLPVHQYLNAVLGVTCQSGHVQIPDLLVLSGVCHMGYSQELVLPTLLAGIDDKKWKVKVGCIQAGLHVVAFSLLSEPWMHPRSVRSVQVMLPALKQMEDLVLRGAHIFFLSGRCTLHRAIIDRIQCKSTWTLPRRRVSQRCSSPSGCPQLCPSLPRRPTIGR